MGVESDSKESTVKDVGGRPTIYTQDLADLICERLANGESMRSVARDKNMPASATMFRWMRSQEGFRDQYEIAKEESADALVEDMLDIADNGAEQELEIDGTEIKAVTQVGVSHARLRVDARKWAASKLKPKKYGDKIQAEHSAGTGITFAMNFDGKKDAD
jgi:uncharacterized protein with von Willebrand factor type A (vWA) domain